jgi:putative glycerol-1-phosphate prenyltransferase
LKSQVYEKLLSKIQNDGAGLLVLIDPDRSDPEAGDTVRLVSDDSPADFILVGTSIQFRDSFDEWLKRLKASCRRPLILFPGSIRQLSSHADAVLFISLVSGRNAEYIIGQQVHGAPLVRSLSLEPIGTGYILVESDTASATELVTGTKPLPAGRTELAVAHALAAEYLGMKLVYLDAGSGAGNLVPIRMVNEVSDAVTIPLIAGGGITKAEDAAELVRAGADLVVVGNALEGSGGIELAREISEAVKLAANETRRTPVEFARR